MDFNAEKEKELHDSLAIESEKIDQLVEGKEQTDQEDVKKWIEQHEGDYVEPESLVKEPIKDYWYSYLKNHDYCKLIRHWRE